MTRGPHENWWIGTHFENVATWGKLYALRELGHLLRTTERWCPLPDSNRNSFRNRILSAARLPIPPKGLSLCPSNILHRPAGQAHLMDAKAPCRAIFQNLATG